MTIRLLATYREFAPNTIVTLATATENALVAEGNATTDLSGGVPFNHKPAPNTRQNGIAYAADGTPLGFSDSTGKILQPFTGVSAPGAPTGLTLTAIAGGVVAAFTAPASNGGTAITGYEVTLSTGQVQLGGTTTVAVNAPAGVAVTATVKALNGYDRSVASAASGSATPTAFTKPSPPGAPTSVTATAGDGQVTVSWTAAAANGAALRNNVVTLSNGRSVAVAGNATSAIIATPNGAAVTATVRANNAAGASPVSAASSSALPTPTMYNQYTIEVQSATTGGACRVAMMSSKRVSLVLQNPAGNSQSFEYAQTSNPNNNRNPPSSGYVSIAPGQQVTFTDVDAVKQLYVKTLTANNKAITALASASLVATATIAGHGLTTGDVRSFEGNVPGGYNMRNVPVTVVDANTITYPLAAATAANTTLGYLYRADEVVSIITGESA